MVNDFIYHIYHGLFVYHVFKTTLMEGGHPLVTAFFAGKALQALTPVYPLLNGMVKQCTFLMVVEVSTALKIAIARESSCLGQDVQGKLIVLKQCVHRGQHTRASFLCSLVRSWDDLSQSVFGCSET